MRRTSVTNIKTQPDAAQSEDVEVSVVVPCLNEAQSIAFCIDKARTALRGADIRGEVVVADNGSTDGSVELAERHGARVVHATQRGYGSALRAGIEGPFSSHVYVTLIGVNPIVAVL